MSPDLLQALRAIHQPRDWADVEAAKRRLAFEELLLLQLKLLLRREIDRTPRSEADLLGTRVTQLDMMEAGRDVLGFRLTAAQDRVLTEVRPAYPWSGLAIKLLCHGLRGVAFAFPRTAGTALCTSRFRSQSPTVFQLRDTQGLTLKLKPQTLSSFADLEKHAGFSPRFCNLTPLEVCKS